MLMTEQVLWLEDLDSLTGFGKRPESLAILRRNPPVSVTTIPVRELRVKTTLAELDAALEVMPDCLRTDAAALARAFARAFEAEQLEVTLDTTRPCNRFHADNVVGRLLCTYVGTGTLWLPEGAFDPGVAERRGTSNEEMVTDPGQVRQLGLWHVGVLKGKKGSLRPVYHRSPDESADSLILKVDLVQL